MIEIQKFQKLKEASQRAKTEADKATGVIDSNLKRLKEEFDCENIEAGEALLKKLESEESVLESEYNKSLEEFETKWGSLI